jgi:predicted site-specific integrase-resolvase
MDVAGERIDELHARLARIEANLELLVSQRTVKEWYTTDEVGSLEGKAPFTVREWCRLGRVKAEKRSCGRGNSQECVTMACSQGQLEQTLQALVAGKESKDFYTTDEVAEILGKAPFTVREWCRLGRVHAEKRACGRGNSRNGLYRAPS